MKKFIKLIGVKVARLTGAEDHIRLQQRIDIAKQLDVGALYFRDSIWKSPRVANAFWHFAAQLHLGYEQPDMKETVHVVTKAANTVLFAQLKPKAEKSEPTNPAA